ncbi:MAG: hypothetical protein ABII01_04105 [Candidatus Woesearchaeota archaeon]
MGHTIMSMRWVIYDEIQKLKKLSDSLREPEHSIANSLLYHIYNNISGITHANPFPKDLLNSMIYTILIEEKKKKGIDVDNLTLLLFSIIVRHKAGKIELEKSDLYKRQISIK